MSQQYDNTNSGALFRNAKKNDGDKRPDYTGSLNVGGKDFWISAWLKTSRNGERFMSLAVQPKEQQKSPQPTAAAGVPGFGHDDMNDKIPF